MKKILKSLLILALVAVVSIPSTLAWFSSTVTAADNQISTGTLMLAVDSTRTHTYSGAWNYYDAYNVAYDDNGDNVNNYTLEAWVNAEPASYVTYETYAIPGADADEPGNKSIWFTVRNRGTLPAKAYVNLTGAWTAAARADYTGLNVNMVRLNNVHLYRGDDGANSNCENHEECQNIRNGLSSLTTTWSYVPTSMVSTSVDRVYDVALNGASFYLTSDLTNSGTQIELQPNEYVIVRMDLSLHTSANDDYQEATYLYSAITNGSQTVTGAPW